MINFKDLKHKEYVGDECIGFVYDLPYGEEKMSCFFRRAENNDKLWQIEVWECTTGNKSDVIYRWIYKMPKSNMSLLMICAFGLMRMQEQMKKEVQLKSELDFVIGDMIGDLHG